MRIRKKFIQLTSYTYPFGTESFLKNYLPDGYQSDEFGNYFLCLGDNPTTMFTCHLDTACGKQSKVTHIQQKNIISTDGKTILGADDKAGMVVMLYMIENEIPGLYYFFIGEEVGCVGSSQVSENWSNNIFSETINKVVSFDRRGTHSVITHQMFEQCCSNEFATELSRRINSAGENLSLRPDDTGIFTDSAEFMNIVPECTNISVGYYSEHTVNERQDIDYLYKLCKSVVKVDWNTLPVARKLESFDFSEILDTEEHPEFSKEFYSHFSFGKEVKKMFISKSLIKKESDLLYHWVLNQGWDDTKSVIWNGNSLSVETTSGDVQFISNRFELLEYLPQLSEVPTKHLSEDITLSN